MLRIRTSNPTATTLDIVIQTTTDTAGASIGISSSGGTPTVTTQPAQVLVESVGTAPLLVGYAQITGLTVNTAYTFTITQTGETSVNGSFSTTVANDTTDYSFIVMTCDFGFSHYSGNSWKEIRALAASKDIRFILMPDDYTYVDGRNINAPPYVSEPSPSSRPDETKDVDNFHKAYGLWAGLYDGYYITHNDDRQWVYNNLPIMTTGGDHYVIDNYRRTTDAPEDQDLYDAAKESWLTWIGNINPPVLALDELWFGYTAGPCSFVFSELQNTCEPPVGAETDKPQYTGPQIADWHTYWANDSKQFSFLLSEGMLDKTQFGWRELHQDEADTWKDAFDLNDDLNGTNGNFVAFTGDRHAQFALQHDTLPEFVTGQVHGQNSVGAEVRETNWGWGGEVKNAATARNLVGDRPLEGFIVVDVNASEPTQTLNITQYQTYRGVLEQTGNFTMVAGAEDNQVTDDRPINTIGRFFENDAVLGVSDELVAMGTSIVQGSANEYIGEYIYGPATGDEFIKKFRTHLSSASATLEATFQLAVYEYDNISEVPGRRVALSDIGLAAIGAKTTYDLPVKGGQVKLTSGKYYIIGITAMSNSLAVADRVRGATSQTSNSSLPTSWSSDGLLARDMAISATIGDGMTTAYGNKDEGPSWDIQVEGTSPQQTVIGGKAAEGVDESTVFTIPEDVTVTSFGFAGKNATDGTQGETLDWILCVYDWNGTTATNVVAGSETPVTTTNVTGSSATNYELVTPSTSFTLPAGDYTLGMANNEADGSGINGGIGVSGFKTSPANCTNAPADDGNVPEDPYTGSNVRNSQPAIWIETEVISGSSSINRQYRHSMPLTGKSGGGKHASPFVKVRK